MCDRVQYNWDNVKYLYFRSDSPAFFFQVTLKKRAIIMHLIQTLPRDYPYFQHFHQGSYKSGRVEFKDFSRAFKDMYQEIQGVQKGFSPLEISKKWHWIVQNATSINFKQLCQIWTCKINLKANFKYFFTNSTTFKDFQVLYEPCFEPKYTNRKLEGNRYCSLRSTTSARTSGPSRGLGLGRRPK
jgi:hypothetical protein